MEKSRNLRRITFALAVLLLVSVLLVGTGSAAGSYTPQLSGNGVLGDPFLISSADELKKVRNATLLSTPAQGGIPADAQLIRDYYSGNIQGDNGQTVSAVSAHYQLTQDIYLDSEPWLPMDGFSGVFDGNGHTIYDLNVVSSVSINSNYAGFMRSVALGGEIKNLNLTNVAVNVDSSVGAIIGYTSANNVKITNCHVSGTIQIEGNKYVGGITGYSHQGTTITSCSVIGDKDSFITGSYQIGGLVGFHSNTAGSIEYCTTDIAVSGNQAVGGLVGRVGDCVEMAVISHCTAKGDVTLLDSSQTSNLVAGSLIGEMFTSGTVKEVSNCESTGSIIIQVADKTKTVSAGFIGAPYNGLTDDEKYASLAVKFTDCTFKLPVSSYTYLTDTANNVITKAFTIVSPQASYSITIGAVTNGKVTADAEEQIKDETVTLTVTPDTGYQTKSVTVTDSIVTSASANTYIFTMPEKAVTVSAEFAKLYYVDIATSEGGTVTADVAETIAGETVTLTVTKTDGYQLDSLTVTKANGGSIDIITEYTFEMPDDDVEVVAKFSKPEVPSAPGKTEPTVEDEVEVKVESDNTATIKPAAGEIPTITVTTEENKEVATIETGSVTIKLTASSAIDKTTDQSGAVTEIKGTFEAVEATYEDAPAELPTGEPVTTGLTLLMKPEAIAANFPMPTIDTTMKPAVTEKVENHKGQTFKPLTMLQATYEESKGGIKVINDNTTKGGIVITFILPENVGEALVAFHVDDDGTVTVLPKDRLTIVNAGGKITATVKGDKFSSYVLAQGTHPDDVKKEEEKSSTPKGSSVWLQEPATPTPTETITPTQTEQVPTTMPTATQTEAESPLSVLAVLSGLGAVAVLRRK